MDVLHAYTAFAGCYDRLMRDVDYDGWAAYLDEFLFAHGRPIKSVLDCACGTGAISLRLQKRGYLVTGLDRSADMLRIAMEHARRSGVTMPFVQQDMRFIQLHRPVDAIVCACDGVNYLTSMADVGAFLSSARDALQPGGLLLFDCSSEYKLFKVLGDHAFGEAEEEYVYLWQNHYDAKAKLSQMQLTCLIKQGMLYERFDERHVQRAHSIGELTGALEAAGFAQVRAYAAFTKNEACAKSERIQYAAVRELH